MFVSKEGTFRAAPRSNPGTSVQQGLLTLAGLGKQGVSAGTLKSDGCAHAIVFLSSSPASSGW